MDIESFLGIIRARPESIRRTDPSRRPFLTTNERQLPTHHFGPTAEDSQQSPALCRRPRDPCPASPNPRTFAEQCPHLSRSSFSGPPPRSSWSRNCSPCAPPAAV